MRRYIYVKILLWSISLCFPCVGLAQNLEQIWQDVNSNNLTLNALKNQNEAERMRNRTGLALANPEAEFAYLWRSPEQTGNRIDFSVTQSFEFPTAYVYRNRIADLRNEQLSATYDVQRQSLLQSVGKLYYEIVYQNVRIEDMDHCLAYLTQTSEAYRRKLDAGTVNIFDYNKVKLAELNLQQERAHAIAERDAMLLQLAQYNGGKNVVVTVSEFPSFDSLPADEVCLEQWVAKGPMMRAISLQQSVNQQQLKLEKTGWAPQFSVGYMREQVPAETFQGLKVGLSLPLWQNVNSVKQARLQVVASDLLAADEQLKARNELRSHWTMVNSLNQQITDYKQLLQSVDVVELLNRALESGEMSMVDYLAEMSLYHESHEQFAELRRDAAEHYVELQVAQWMARQD